MSFRCYLRRCADGTYYAGHTDNLEQRVAQHRQDGIDGYTAKRLPVELVWSQEFATREQPSSRSRAGAERRRKP